MAEIVGLDGKKIDDGKGQLMPREDIVEQLNYLTKLAQKGKIKALTAIASMVGERDYIYVECTVENDFNGMIGALEIQKNALLNGDDEDEDDVEEIDTSEEDDDIADVLTGLDEQLDAELIKAAENPLPNKLTVVDNGHE
jgi:hypothetical protein